MRFLLLLACLAEAHGDTIGSVSRWLIKGIGAELFANLVHSGAGPPIEDMRRSHAGQLAVVTGATGGLGAEVVIGLSRRGFHVIVAARDISRGEALVARIESAGGLADFRQVDLAAPESVRGLAAEIIADGRPVSLLINNAAVMGSSVSKATTLQVNLLAPMALTLDLLPIMLQSDQPRVVNVASSSHLRACSVPAETLRADANTPDRNLRAYAQTKLGIMQFSTALRRAAGPQLTVHDCHPGLVWTPMLRAQFGEPLCHFLRLTRLRHLLFKTPERGAATVLSAALAPSQSPVGSESYFVNNRPSPRSASPESRDIAASELLWETALAMIK